ncbi:hypothetical protein NBO_11g0004 [Nosema bombycis CQ1]|uniref:Proliferating cell nuclear antigen n=1 Tax=Nosema bombycis (strain CQ1 / CVCC 102059) TaxID=578461 RepID=R0KVN1_NOSB1|nr:hypothetical protein NBO_11g0004 [Nosema bombycis CQ1]|eukprot:EOB14931.1 hypothetical protein NBO_11g0004 [Nosema bombycis CQ1]
MDCIISPKNALLLDKLMNSIKSNELIIDSNSKLLLQMVSDDKTKCCNISLDNDFFISVSLKNKLVVMNKPKFYMNKMKVLKIFTYDNMLVFDYEFEDYVYRHRFFAHKTNIFTINFTPCKVTNVDINLFLEVLKQVKNGDSKFVFDEEFAYIQNGENTIKFKCSNFNNVSFELCPTIFRMILSSCKMFNEAILCWENKGCPINLIFRSANIQASYFCAV